MIAEPKALSWRDTERKNCAGCQVEMRPTPKQKRSHWDSISNCSPKCGAASRRDRVVGPLDPADQHTPGARLRWLRLSQSPCGRKKPISQDVMGAACKIGRKSLASIEQGLASAWGDPEDIQRLCLYLGAPVEWLTIPTEKWVRKVTALKLTARDMQTSTGSESDVATVVKISRKTS